jgi:predicted nucleotidyltransferase
MEVAERLGVSERTLRRIGAVGLVRGAREDWRGLGEGEREWLLAHWGLVGGLREALRTEPNVSMAWIFGSVAKGTDDEGSDIDLVVDLKVADLVSLRGVQRRLEAKLGRAVDIFRQGDLEAEPEILLPLLKQARVVIDREGWWERLEQHRHRLRQRLQALRARRPEWALLR